LGLFFLEIRNRVAFRLLYQHFAARTEADRDVKRGDGGGDRMSLVKRVIAALLLTGAAALLLASSTLAQERVGVVTNIEGFATVARVALPEPEPLHFRDDLFLRDRITTGERSIVRVLLGGKATVTARERSVLTITEVPGVATINLGAGRIAVAVAKGLMKPGEVIQIKTPNAVTAIRGTVVIAEVEPVPQGHQSTITILRGLVDVTRLDSAGALTGPAVKVGALERVTVVNAQPVPAPQKITRDAASRLAADFSFVPKNAPAASAEALGAEVKDITMRDAMQIIGELSPAPPTGTSVGAATNGLSNVFSGTTNTLNTVTGGATDTLNGVTGAATGAVTGLTSPVTQAVAPVVNPVTSPVTNLVTTVTNTVNNVTSPVTNPILPGLLRSP